MSGEVIVVVGSMDDAIEAAVVSIPWSWAGSTTELFWQYTAKNGWQKMAGPVGYTVAAAPAIRQAAEGDYEDAFCTVLKAGSTGFLGGLVGGAATGAALGTEAGPVGWVAGAGFGILFGVGAELGSGASQLVVVRYYNQQKRQGVGEEIAFLLDQGTMLSNRLVEIDKAISKTCCGDCASSSGTGGAE